MRHALLFTLFFIILFSTHLSAQDTIIFIDNKEVLAKVLEIGKTIKYKKYSNLEGPTYIAEQHEVYSIIYSNGEKDIFNKTREIYIEKETTIIIENKIDSYDDGIVENYLYLNNNGFNKQYYEGYKQLSKEAFIEKLQTSPKAMETYDAGQNLKTNGNILTFLGGAVMMVGIIRRVIDITSNLDRPTFLAQKEKRYTGIGALITGGVISVIGGGVKRRGVARQLNALDIYNISVSERTSVGFSETGIGLRVRF